MKHVLHIGGMEELLDIADWLETHAGESDVPAGAIEAAEWLHDIDMAQTFVTVPPEHVPALQWAIADWCEVLSAHQEEFATHLDAVTVIQVSP